MRRASCLVIAVWLVAAAPLFGQELLPPSFPGSDPLLGTLDPNQPREIVVETTTTRLAPTGPLRWWVRGEYLSWWVKDSPLPVSLVTTGNTNNNVGAELLNSNRHLGSFAGMRVNVGRWFDQYQNVGVETGIFFLGRRTDHFFVSSDSDGSPLLAFPFTNQTPGSPGEFLMPITSPGQYAGSVLVSSALEMWGAEVNGIVVLRREPGIELSVLGGFRYLELRERLTISSISSDLTTNPNTISILDDCFRTRNQFSGGQLGARVNWQGSWLALDLTGKVALGSTHRTIDVQGESTQFGPIQPNGTFPGGLFTQPSNMGRQTSNEFTVIPSLEAKLHFFVTPRLRAFIGYDFLYWGHVARPGNQIDRNINLTQSAILGNTNGVLSGSASPGPMNNRSDFFTHGISFGFEMRF